MDKSLIRKNYLTGNFFVDLLSSIPFESFVTPETNYLRIVTMTKLLRIKKLTQIIDNANMDEEKKSQFRIMQLVFLLFLMMHVVGCLWHAIVMFNQIWVIPKDFVWAAWYPKIYHFYKKSDQSKYYDSLYTALIFLGGNEVGPRSDLEMWSSTLILMMLAIFNAWLFGDMAVLSEASGRKQSGFQQQIDVANTAMKQMDLPLQF